MADFTSSSSQPPSFRLKATLSSVLATAAPIIATAGSPLAQDVHAAAAVSTQLPPKVGGEQIVTDSYTKTEMDAKLALQAERAARASDDVKRDVQEILKAVAGITQGLIDLKGEVRDDNKQTRNTIITFALGSLGVVITIAALVWGAQGNMTTQNGNVLAAFGAGKEAEVAAREAAAAATPPPLYDAQTGKKLVAQ